MQLTSILKTLVETESPSHDKAAVDRVGALVAEEARKLGAQVEVVPNMILVTISSHVLHQVSLHPSTSSFYFILCHMDTVFRSVRSQDCLSRGR